MTPLSRSCRSDLAQLRRERAARLGADEQPSGDPTYAAIGEFVSKYSAEIICVLDEADSTWRANDVCNILRARFPGLLPRQEQIDDDAKRPLGSKAGWEREDASLVSALLAASDLGSRLLHAGLCPRPRALLLLEEYERTGAVDLARGSIRRSSAGIATVEMRNPDALNAEDQTVLEDLEVLVDVAVLDTKTTVGIFRGGIVNNKRYRGQRIFSAGLNLPLLAAGEIPLIRYMIERELGLIRKVRHGVRHKGRSFQMPWLACVESFAIGGGFQLAIACDGITAERDAFFSLPAGDEGFIPGMANLILTESVGRRIAQRMILGNERVEANSLLGQLFAESISASPYDAALRLAERYAMPGAIANKAMLLNAHSADAKSALYIAQFASLQGERLLSADVATRLSAWRK